MSTRPLTTMNNGVVKTIAGAAVLVSLVLLPRFLPSPLRADNERVTLAGVVFNDKNNNGSRNEGEEGLAGWRVELDLNTDGTIDRFAITAADGSYRFDNVAPGMNTLHLVKQPGWTLSSPPTGRYRVETNKDVVSNKFNFGCCQ